jgi:regulator of RNase E activity RraA
MPPNLKLLLLKELGLSANADGYVTKDGKQVQDKYIEQPVRVENMAIFPGSTIVLDDNPVSIASYIEEYGEV